MPSIYEDKARLEKALKIAALVPNGETAEEVEKTVAWLRARSTDERNVFAFCAKVKPPSDETWEMVCKLVGNRAPQRAFGRAPSEPRRPGDAFDTGHEACGGRGCPVCCPEAAS